MWIKASSSSFPLPLLLLFKLLQCHSIWLLLLLLLRQLGEHDTHAKDLSSLLLRPSMTRLR